MVEQYRFCPWKFKRVYLDKVPQATSIQMLIGTRFHSFAEEFFDHYESLPEDRWEEFIPEDFSEFEYGMAKWFLEMEKNRLDGLRKIGKGELFVPLVREMRMVSDKLSLSGHVDRIDKWGEDGELTIVEYKTGRKLDLTGLKREMSFYKILWDELYADQGTVTRFLIINPNLKEVKYVNAAKASYAAAKRAINTLRKAIEDNDFPRVCNERKNAMCKMCSPDEVEDVWKETT